jgi:hypothetical protein
MQHFQGPHSKSSSVQVNIDPTALFLAHVVVLEMLPRHDRPALPSACDLHRLGSKVVVYVGLERIIPERGRATARVTVPPGRYPVFALHWSVVVMLGVICGGCGTAAPGPGGVGGGAPAIAVTPGPAFCCAACCAICISICAFFIKAPLIAA